MRFDRVRAALTPTFALGLGLVALALVNYATGAYGAAVAAAVGAAVALAFDHLT